MTTVGVSDLDLRTLGRCCPLLTRINIRGCDTTLTGEGFRGIAERCQVRELNILECGGLSEAGLSRLAAGSMPHLCLLDLQDQDIEEGECLYGEVALSMERGLMQLSLHAPISMPCVWGNSLETNTAL